MWQPISRSRPSRACASRRSRRRLVSARRWRWPPTVGAAIPSVARVSIDAGGGLLRGSAMVDAADVFVFPTAPPQSTAIPRTELLDRLGTHLTRHIGPGVEYADVRRYVPGDQLRTVNWPVSARRGSLHVTERLTDRAADVVVLIDRYPQPPGPATEATDRTVRGAVQVVQSALRIWRSRRHRRARRPPPPLAWRGHRPAAVLPDSRRGARRRRRLRNPARDVGAPRGRSARRDRRRVLHAARHRIRAGADRSAQTRSHRRRRRRPGGRAVRGGVRPLVARMWSLQRSFMYRDMGTIGVDVVSWRGDATLDQAMHLVPDRRRRVRRSGDEHA